MIHFLGSGWIVEAESRTGHREHRPYLHSPQPPVLLSDYLSSMQAKTFSKMSGIELTDIQIPGTSLPSRIPSSSTPKKGELSETKGPDSNLNSGYDDMDGFQKLGPACGLYNQRRVYSILFPSPSDPSQALLIRTLPYLAYLLSHPS